MTRPTDMDASASADGLLKGQPEGDLLRQALLSELAGLPKPASAESLADLPGLTELGEWFRDRRQSLHGQGRRGQSLDLAMRESLLADATVEHIYQTARDAVSVAGLSCDDAQSCGVAIGALGSYGRSQLVPRSDIDLVVLTREADCLACDRMVKLVYHAVFGVFCSAAGVEIGYSCRTPTDPGELGLKTQTSLYDLRHVAGDGVLVREFEDALSSRRDHAQLLLALSEEREAQHLDYSPAIYRVEPDLKRGPGSLRDLLSGISHARVAFGLHGPDALALLAERDVLYDREYQEIRVALAQLLDERRALHLVAGRRNDVLYQSLKDAVAESLGYAALPGLTAVDQLMRDHFRAARCIDHYAKLLCRRSHRASVPVRHGFVVCERELRHRAPVEVVSSPELAVEAVAWSDRYRVPIDAELQDAIRVAARRVEPIQAPSASARAFTEILTGRGQPEVALRYLRDLGLLGGLVPELGKCEDRVANDPTHEYSILEHTLRVVEALTDLGKASGASPSTLARVYGALAPEARRALLFAALMHDAAKVVAHEHHSEAGAFLARKVGNRIGLPSAETERAARLVEIHLQMARVSRLRDLHNAATIREFREVAGNAETLDQLYLLTYADTRSVGLGVFGDIEGRLLEDLYAKTLAAFASGMEPTDLAEAAAAMTERAVRELRFRDVSQDRVREHCLEMLPQYVVTTPLETIGYHISMVRDLARDGRPVIDFHNRPDVNYTELTLCTYDEPQPGLFSKICGTLLANGIDIHRATIRTRVGREQIAVDSLLIDVAGERIPEDVQQRTEADLRQVLAGEMQVEALLERRKRAPQPAELLSVEARNGVADGRTVVTVKARDALGLLYRFTRSIAWCGLNLHSAQITTWGAHAEDSFYVTGPEGGPVPDDRIAAIEAQLAETIRGQA